MQIYRGVVPFVIVQLIALVLTISFPALVYTLTGGKKIVDTTGVKIQAPSNDYAPGGGGGIYGAPANPYGPGPADPFGPAPKK